MLTVLRSSALIAVCVICACAQGVDTQQLEHAMLAQTSGMGGCTTIDERRDLAVLFFPGVRVVEGECAREHGDTAYALVGIGNTGQLFLLGSAEGFEFMRRAHPVTPVDSASLLAYSATAMRLMGAIGARDTVVTHLDDLSDSILTRAGVKRTQLRPSAVLRSTGHGKVVALTTLGPHRLSTLVVLLYPADGGTRVIEREEWRINP
jgi:hypothetical protein